jgi:hypothetical protein
MCQQCNQKQYAADAAKADAEAVNRAAQAAGFLNLRLALLPNDAATVRQELSRQVFRMLGTDGTDDDFEPQVEALNTAVLVLTMALADSVLAGKELDAELNRKEDQK